MFKIRLLDVNKLSHKYLPNLPDFENPAGILSHNYFLSNLPDINPSEV